jgi:outer membrane lipoprotein SlyB
MNSNTRVISGPGLDKIIRLVAGAAALVLILTLAGIGVVTGLKPSGESRSDLREMRQAIVEYRPVPGSCAICGTVDSIRAVQVAGDATGAAVGRQPGTGEGNPVMTILGAAGGVFAGEEIDKNAKGQFAYRVTIRMDDGSFRTVSLPSIPAFTVGDKVRVVEGRLVRA